MLDGTARDSLDYICNEWSGAEKAWLAIEWVLARDAYVGVPLTEKANVRGFEYLGAKSIHQPDLYVVYHVLPHEIVVKVIAYDEARAPSAGHS